MTARIFSPLVCRQNRSVGCPHLVSRGFGGSGTGRWGFNMDQTQQLLAMTLAAAFGIVATLAILRKHRRAPEPPRESPFATSTEGEKLCPTCGMGNLWTDDRCISCDVKLPG